MPRLVAKQSDVRTSFLRQKQCDTFTSHRSYAHGLSTSARRHDSSLEDCRSCPVTVWTRILIVAERAEKRTTSSNRQSLLCYWPDSSGLALRLEIWEFGISGGGTLEGDLIRFLHTMRSVDTNAWSQRQSFSSWEIELWLVLSFWYFSDQWWWLQLPRLVRAWSGLFRF